MRVTADLSAVGGGAAESLSRSGAGAWTWTGSVTPATAGQSSITITAADDSGRALAAYLNAVVASDPANGGANGNYTVRWPGFYGISMLIGGDGVLVRGRRTYIQICGMAEAADESRGITATTAVVVDLHELGGGAAVPMTKSGATGWVLNVEVSPPGAGDKFVNATARDAAGFPVLRSYAVKVREW